MQQFSNRAPMPRLLSLTQSAFPFVFFSRAPHACVHVYSDPSLDNWINLHSSVTKQIAYTLLGCKFDQSCIQHTHSDIHFNHTLNALFDLFFIAHVVLITFASLEISDWGAASHTFTLIIWLFYSSTAFSHLAFSWVFTTIFCSWFNNNQIYLRQ